MHKLIKVDIVEGKPSVTSLQVAEAFGKEHRNVLAYVRGSMSKYSELFNGLNFQLVDYFDSKGEKRPMYALSKDGCLMLAMGYNTCEAMKVRYPRQSRRHLGMNTTWYLHSQLVWFNFGTAFIGKVSPARSERSQGEAFLYSRNCQTLRVPQQSWGYAFLN